MKRFTEIYGGRFLRAADIDESGMRATISEITEEKMEDGATKLVVSFEGIGKQLVVNKVNGNKLLEVFGDDPESWVGHRVELYTSETTFNGKTVPCIRLRVPRKKPTPLSQEEEDDVNF